jgi:serine/threonine protein kinase
VSPLDFTIHRERVIGFGSFGTVYEAQKAVAPEEGLPVAAKTVPKERLSGVQLEDAMYYCAIERYANDQVRAAIESGDAKRLARHVARYLGYGTHAGQEWLFFERVPGQTLEHYFDTTDDDETFALALGQALGLMQLHGQDGPVDLLRRLFLRVAHDTLQTLAAFAQLGMVHRDMKPLNWMVDERAHTLRMLDLGSAAFLSTPRYGAVIGYNARWGPADTDYVAPESFIDPRFPFQFDVYSCAMSLLRIAIPGLRSAAQFRSFAEEFRNLHQSDLALYASRAFAGNAFFIPEQFVTGLIVLKGEDGRLFELVRGMLRESPQDRLSPEAALVELGKIKARTPA